ncbi:MAG: class I SAM-dependent methyltransferase [Pseudomonadota bacterium]
MAEGGIDKQQADWDARYRAQPAPFGDGPNHWAVMALAHPLIAAGAAAGAARRALCLADGDGRNGTWLARQGLEVTALDLSAEATRQAKARDAAAGVSVARLEADVTAWTPRQTWDLVFLIYLQGPPALRRAGLQAAMAALAPGGWLVMEGFAVPPEGAAEVVGPSTPAHRWRAADLADWAPELTARDVMTGRLLLDEGPRHAGTATVLRALLQAPD